MTTLCEVGAVREFGRLATRPAGERARQFIAEILTRCEVLQIDMAGMNVSPSFADECFGLLAEELGISEFRKRIRFVNIQEAAQHLILHVIYRRGAQKTKVRPLS